MFVIDLIGVLGQRLAVELEADQLELLTIQHQRRLLILRLRIAPHPQLAAHPRMIVMQTHVQRDLVDQKDGRAVILQIMSGWAGFTHV
jgi:hypothetical protein